MDGEKGLRCQVKSNRRALPEFIVRVQSCYHFCMTSLDRWPCRRKSPNRDPNSTHD